MTVDVELENEAARLAERRWRERARPGLEAEAQSPAGDRQPARAFRRKGPKASACSSSSPPTLDAATQARSSGP